MDRIPPDQRQLQGCGYLPPPAESIRPFVRPEVGCGYSGPPLTVCPGYSTNLPEVIEASRARLHWTKGALRLADYSLNHPLVVEIEVLEGACNELQAWTMTPQSKGGGGHG